MRIFNDEARQRGVKASGYKHNHEGGDGIDQIGFPVLPVAGMNAPGDVAWGLFAVSGNIGYYLLYNNLNGT